MSDLAGNMRKAHNCDRGIDARNTGRTGKANSMHSSNSFARYNKAIMCIKATELCVECCIDPILLSNNPFA